MAHRLFLVVAAVFVGISTTSAQQTLLAVDDKQLIKIDPVSATVTVLGALTIPGVPSGLDFRAGKLYTTPEISRDIYQIDANTGATVSGPITLAGPFPSLEGDLAFRPSDGVGFITADGGGVWRFDLSAPVPTLTSLTGGPPGLDGLAFDAAGTLWGLEAGGKQLYTIDQVTGAATKIGAPTGFSAGISVGGLAIDNTGKVYGIRSTFPAIMTLFTIDPVTGIGTKIADIPWAFGIRGIRFVPAPPPPPTPPAAGPASPGEGTYVGSTSPSHAPEGSFGFGGHERLRFRAPILLRPDASGSTNRVFNVAFQNDAAADADSDNGFTLLAPLVFGAIGVSLLFGLRRLT